MIDLETIRLLSCITQCANRAIEDRQTAAALDPSFILRTFEIHSGSQHILGPTHPLHTTDHSLPRELHKALATLCVGRHRADSSCLSRRLVVAERDIRDWPSTVVSPLHTTSVISTFQLQAHCNATWFNVLCDCLAACEPLVAALRAQKLCRFG